MTVEEIRKASNAAYETVKTRMDQCSASDLIEYAQINVLFEIAAQLAELNTILRAIFHVPDMPDSFKGTPDRFAPNAHLKIDKLY